MTHVLNPMRRGSLAAVCLAVVTALSGTASAITVHFDEPTLWNVGDFNTTSQLWKSGDTSASPIHANLTHTANPGQPAPTLTPAGAFVASSGGYYSFSSNYTATAAIDAPASMGPGTYVLVQTAATLNPDGGSVLKDAIKILDDQGNTLATSAAANVQQTFHDPNFPLFGGVEYEELLWSVFLPGYTGDFDVKLEMMVHSSLQALRVDSFTPVPEPSTFVLLALGAALPIARCIKRRKAAN
jgi:hypothetical protein